MTRHPTNTPAAPAWHSTPTPTGPRPPGQDGHAQHHAASSTLGARRVHPAWYAGGLVVAVALLAGYWTVLNDGVQRAHQHWAGAQRLDALGEACAVVNARHTAPCGRSDEGAGRMAVRTSAVR